MNRILHKIHEWQFQKMTSKTVAIVYLIWRPPSHSPDFISLVFVALFFWANPSPSSPQRIFLLLFFSIPCEGPKRNDLNFWLDANGGFKHIPLLFFSTAPNSIWKQPVQGFFSNPQNITVVHVGLMRTRGGGWWVWTPLWTHHHLQLPIETRCRGAISTVVFSPTAPLMPVSRTPSFQTAAKTNVGSCVAVRGNTATASWDWAVSFFS